MPLDPTYGFQVREASELFDVMTSAADAHLAALGLPGVVWEDSPEYAQVLAVAKVLNLHSQDTAAVWRAAFPELAEGVTLDHHLPGLRLVATASSATWQITAEGGNVTLPLGFTISDGAHQWRADVVHTNQTILDGDTADITATCTETGAITFEADAPFAPVGSFPNIGSITYDAENPTLDVGRAAESDPAMKARLLGDGPARLAGTYGMIRRKVRELGWIRSLHIGSAEDWGLQVSVHPLPAGEQITELRDTLAAVVPFPTPFHGDQVEAVDLPGANANLWDIKWSGETTQAVDVTFDFVRGAQHVSATVQALAEAAVAALFDSIGKGDELRTVDVAIALGGVGPVASVPLESIRLNGVAATAAPNTGNTRLVAGTITGTDVTP